jgi:hypothetical protein
MMEAEFNAGYAARSLISRLSRGSRSEKTLEAIGTVLAMPTVSNPMPTRFLRLAGIRSASSNPSPNPRATRVIATANN